MAAVKTGIVRVSGVDETIKNLNKELRKVVFKSKKNMIKAGLFIQREAQLKTPVDTGNLRASAATVWDTGAVNKSPSFEGDDGDVMKLDHGTMIWEERSQMAKDPWNYTVEVIYSAYYAIYVHENVDARFTVGEAQFLKKAIDQNREEILAIVRTGVV